MHIYLIHTLSFIYAMKLLVIFGIKIYRKLSSYLTTFTSLPDFQRDSFDVRSKYQCPRSVSFTARANLSFELKLEV